MFTGIIQALGQVTERLSKGVDLSLVFQATSLDFATVALGYSLSVNGVCLTVADKGLDWFRADVSAETLRCTLLGELQTGDPVNIEKALTLATPLGGHLVSGHVDGIAEVLERENIGRGIRMSFQVPTALAHYIAVKGSVCIDGVSLTVNAVTENVFDVTLVPHTLEHTIMRNYASGTRVNLEVDLIARYLERLINKS